MHTLRSMLHTLSTVAVLGLMVGPALADDDPAAGIARIEVQPKQALLHGARETAQLVITGYDASGATRDLTRAAQVSSLDETIASVAAGRILARGNGRTQVDIRVGGQHASIAVETSAVDRPDPIRFGSEVLPALTKQGCNAGSCHGAPEGKGGFALSMLAYKPSIDAVSLITGGLARRVEPLAPAESLLLKKPLLRVTHVGGKRLHFTDAAYRVLAAWIAEGARLDRTDAPHCVGISVMPGPARVIVAPFLRQQLSVAAQFSDGTSRDVTALATYASSSKDTAVPDADGLVTGHERGLAAITVRYLDFVQSVYFTVIRPVEGFAAAWNDPPENNYVDRLVHARLKQLQFVPSGLCDDATFLRRLHLDLTGLPPTADRVRAFLADQAANKRGALIDALLASEEFARFWAQKEADLYRVNPQLLDHELLKTDAQRILAGRAALFSQWLADEWRRGAPYDRHVRELLTAVGDTHVVGPSNFFEAIPKQDDISEATAQLFMGSRINCAKCHNHPFESWTQDDYYRIVAVFTRVRQDNDEITVAPKGEATNPSTGKIMVPWGLETVSQAAGKPDADRREMFTAWLTKHDNPYFARVAVNRIWAHLLGRGIVHPVDDFRSSNPPTNPELLDALAADFENRGYDRKHVVRTICNSRAYQHATATTPWNEADQTLFSHYVPRRLTGEQLRDAIGYASRTLAPIAGIDAEIRQREAESAARLETIHSEQPAWERQLHEQLQRAPAWNGVWHSIGPFRAKTIDDAHQGRFAPDVAIDLNADVDSGVVASGAVDSRSADAAPRPGAATPKKTAAALRWTKELAWRDGHDLTFEAPRNSARYFHAVLHVRQQGTARLALSSDAPLRVALDGQEVYESGAKKQRKSSADVPLELSPGEHSLVIKVSSPDKRCKLRASLTKWNDKPLPRFDARRDAVELLAGAADSLPPDLRAAVVARRETDDGQAQRLQKTIQSLQFRMTYHTQRPFPEASQFATAFGQPKRETACACERSSDPTLDQALSLLNGEQTHAASLDGAAKYAPFDDAALCDEVYLSAFARSPSDVERARVVAFVKGATNRNEAIRDLLWTIFNTQEFLFQH